MSTAPDAAKSAAKHEEGFFDGHDGLRLFWQSFTVERPRAHVAFFHGWLDHSTRYRHVFERLNARGYSVHSFDMRGCGQSQGRRGHVHSYDELTGDVSLFLDRVEKSAGGKPFLVAHSNGALVSGLFLAGKDRVRGCVFTSPYFGNAIKPNLGQLFAAHVIGRVIPTLPIKAPLPSTVLTSDPEWQKNIDADPLLARSLTPAWYRAFLIAQSTAMQRAPEFKIPVLVLQSGGDTVADPKTAREWCERAGSTDKRYTEYPGLRHEMLMEREADRNKAIDEIAAWLDAH
jgi:lysophospholipase